MNRREFFKRALGAGLLASGIAQVEATEVLTRIYPATSAMGNTVLVLPSITNGIPDHTHDISHTHDLPPYGHGYTIFDLETVL